MKVCFITSSRADYGLLYRLMKLFDKDKFFKFQCIATGSHLSKKFGYTYKDILKDKIKIDHFVDIGVEKNSLETDIAKSLGSAISKISLKLKKILKSDLIILLETDMKYLQPAQQLIFIKFQYVIYMEEN